MNIILNSIKFRYSLLVGERLFGLGLLYLKHVISLSSLHGRKIKKRLGWSAGGVCFSAQAAKEAKVSNNQLCSNYGPKVASWAQPVVKWGQNLSYISFWGWLLAYYDL